MQKLLEWRRQHLINGRLDDLPAELYLLRLRHLLPYSADTVHIWAALSMLNVMSVPRLMKPSVCCVQKVFFFWIQPDNPRSIAVLPLCEIGFIIGGKHTPSSGDNPLHQRAYGVVVQLAAAVQIGAKFGQPYAYGDR